MSGDLGSGRLPSLLLISIQLATVLLELANLSRMPPVDSGVSVMANERSPLPGFDADELWRSWFVLGPQAVAFQVNAEFCLGQRQYLDAALNAASLKLGRRYGVFLADLRGFAACAISRDPASPGGLVERRLFCLPVYASVAAIARLVNEADTGTELCNLMRRHGLVAAPGSDLALWPWPSTPLAASGAHPSAVRELAASLGAMVGSNTPATVAAVVRAFDAVDGGADPTLAKTIAGLPGMAHCLLFGARVARFRANASRPSDWLATGRCTDIFLDRWTVDAAALFGPEAVVSPPVALDQALLRTACLGVQLALQRLGAPPRRVLDLPNELHVFRDETAGQVDVMHCSGNLVRGPVRLPWGLVATGFAEFLDMLADQDGAALVLHHKRLHRATIAARRRGNTPWETPGD